MQQLIILIVALALAGGVYLFLTISKKKSKEQTEENAVEMMTANEMINVTQLSAYPPKNFLCLLICCQFQRQKNVSDSRP